jgi:NTP pyrophosphatase (non-canonical NTP hydrolase)
MDFSEYQKRSRETAIYPGKDKDFIYPALGVAGEAGEVIEKIKKAVREDSGKITAERKEALQKEMGDLLWYLAQLATETGIDLNQVAEENLAKLLSRKERGKLRGDGDNR